MTNEPRQPPRRQRLVLCMGQYCNRGGRTEPFYERLRQAFGEPGPAWLVRSPRRIHWEIANCLSLCGAAPNLILYPDEVIYHHLDSATLERIIAERLKVEDSGT